MVVTGGENLLIDEYPVCCLELNNVVVNPEGSNVGRIYYLT